MLKVRATYHAVERWHERVRPNLTLTAAESDLIRVAQGIGRVSDVRPDWAGPGDNRPRAPRERRYMLVGDDICLVLERRSRDSWVVLTVLTRSGLSPQARKRRNNKAAAKRRARAIKRRH